MLLHPDYLHLKTFLSGLPAVFETQGTYIYGGQRNLIKTFTAPDGTVLNVKRYARPKGPNLLVYSLGIRQPKGLRAYRYPAILLSRGIDTPQPVAYWEERRLGLLGYSFFVSLQCPYGHRLYEVGDARPGTYEELAAALARFTAHMHDQEVTHLDYSPGNVLWERDAEGFHFSIVDTNRMRFGKVSLRQGCANLCRLWGPKRFFELVVEHYALARGFDPAEALPLALEARRRFWERFQRRHRVGFPLEL